MSASVGTL